MPTRKTKSLTIPHLGRFQVGHESPQGGGNILGSMGFTTNLELELHRDGKPLATKNAMPFWARWWNSVDGNGNVIDLGSGKVTNVGVNLMTWNDEASVLGATLSLMNFHAIGTGATADAAADYYLQTANGATNLSGTTNGYMTGTQSVVAPNTYKTSATFTLTGSIAISEWVLTMSNAANFSRTETGTPTSTTFPDSGAAFTTTGNGLKGWTIEINSTAINTSPTTTTQGLVTANTATSLTIAEGWWHLDNSSASTPSASSAYVVYPTAFDHRQFSTVNLGSGDSCTVNYSVSINSGG